jgi:hypothetical protein
VGTLTAIDFKAKGEICAVNAPLVSYAVDGKQHVAVAAGALGFRQGRNNYRSP